MTTTKHIALIFLIIAVLGCQSTDRPLFKQVSSGHSGIHFINKLEVNDSINSVFFEYIYNGSGVAVGDVNNDGLEDLFFGGNMVTSRLYLNQGNLQFLDVTEASGITTDRWCTGISMVDINEDGLLDVYICVAGKDENADRRNIFFINQGIDGEGVPHFIDKAAEMGLDDTGYSTMGVFFDYDKDRDMDLYILTNAMKGSERNLIRHIKKNGEAESTDRLYRNNGDGTFTNASREAGILIEGLGLGVKLVDINQDGWMDVYCANDFISNDLLWINNGDGTFSEKAGEYFKHFTYSGMGMDIADYNNDGLPDVLVLDMLPYTNLRQKLMVGYRNLDKFYTSIDSGYHPQFMRNTLQLNMGKFRDGKYRFSEISYLAGMYQTDWSWAPLLADFDHDGWKDLLITNGFRKDVTNLDFIYNTVMVQSPFGTEEAKKEKMARSMQQLPDVKLPNYIFKNNRNLTFEDRSAEWGLDVPTFSNGTAIADLDGDGDLDIIINNIDQEAMIFENLTNERPHKENHFLSIRFDKTVKESDLHGMKCWIFHDNNRQFHEFSPYRGYKSSMGRQIHAGLGRSGQIDSLIIQWPDGAVQKMQDIRSDTTLVVNRTDKMISSSGSYFSDFNRKYPGLSFRDITAEKKLDHKHIETSPIDLDFTYTLIHNLSQHGPALAVGDVNNDGLDDLFVGSDPGHSSVIYLQQKDHTFRPRPLNLDIEHEDMGALFFDYDHDGDPDLYVVSGGSTGNYDAPLYRDRLYINVGKGEFSRADSLIPATLMSGSCVTAADYDLDGDLDLFVGRRVYPRRYPETPQSYLLENNEGKFVDRSDLLADEGKLGMVNSAVWTDVNGDLRPDLIVVGEWMPIRVLINTENGFTDQSDRYGTGDTHGWWNSIKAEDLDNDGDIDYVVGNYGLNSFYKPSKEKPVEIWAKDYDKNGTVDPILTHYIEGESYIVHPKDLISAQIPSMRTRFRTYESYGTTPFKQSFLEEELEGSVHLKCTRMGSVILENIGGDELKIRPLPLEVQFSPVYGIAFEDFDRDGLTDIFLVGNSYAEETLFGYYDASYGTVLLNKGDWEWECPRPNRINLVADGNKKALVRILSGNRQVFVSSRNGGFLQAHDTSEGASSRFIVPAPDEWQANLIFFDGTRKKIEFPYGGGYLSQDSRALKLPSDIERVEMISFTGDRRMIEIE